MEWDWRDTGRERDRVRGPSHNVHWCCQQGGERGGLEVLVGCIVARGPCSMIVIHWLFSELLPTCSYLSVCQYAPCKAPSPSPLMLIDASLLPACTFSNGSYSYQVGHAHQYQRILLASTITFSTSTYRYISFAFLGLP